MIKMEVAFPIVIAKEGRWYVASCPSLDIATQGKTEDEVKKNMKALINEYLKDPDTHKPDMKHLLALSLTSVSIKV